MVSAENMYGEVSILKAFQYHITVQLRSVSIQSRGEILNQTAIV